MRFHAPNERYWLEIEKKLAAFGLDLRTRHQDFDTRKFQARVALEGAKAEAVLVLLHGWVTAWVDGHDPGSEAKIDAVIKQVVSHLRGD